MNRKLVLLNLALLALVGTLVWSLRVHYLEAKQRERETLQRTARARSLAALPPVVAPAPAYPAEYIAVAQQMLFSKDRNPNVPEEPKPLPPPPPPMPALPEAYGVMNLFGDHVIILSLGKNAQKSYRTGDSIGPFKVVRFDSESVVFEWDGKEVERPIRELLAKNDPQKSPPQQQAPYQAPGPPQASTTQAPSVQPISEISSSNADKNPTLGTDMGQGYRACSSGDTSPAGTVLNGYKKVIGRTVMGPSCHWEKVN
jgi:hypothetical protein